MGVVFTLTIFVLSLYFVCFSSVSCLPSQERTKNIDEDGGGGGSIMDQLYDEIQGYVDQKRSSIPKVEILNVPLNDTFMSHENEGIDLAIYPEDKKKSNVDHLQNVGNHTKFLVKSDIEKQLINVTVKIPIFQASDKTKHKNASDGQNKNITRKHNVKLMDMSDFKVDENNDNTDSENTTIASNMTVVGHQNDTKSNSTTLLNETLAANVGSNLTLRNETQVSSDKTNNTLISNNTNSVTNSSFSSLNVTADDPSRMTVFALTDERSPDDPSSGQTENESAALNNTSGGETDTGNMHENNSTNEGEIDTASQIVRNSTNSTAIMNPHDAGNMHDNNSTNGGEIDTTSRVVNNSTNSTAIMNPDDTPVHMSNDGNLTSNDHEDGSGDQEQNAFHLNNATQEVRVKRQYYWDHGSNEMEMHNNPHYHGGDFMHGGAHDEFHNIDEHGSRLDLGQVDLAPEPQLNYHQSHVHEEPHFHHYEPHNEYTDVHNDPQYYSQEVHHEPHYHHNYNHEEPHYQHDEHHFHDNHQEHFHNEPHYLNNEVHIHHNHENFHDEPEEHHSGDSGNYHRGKFHHVKVKLHGPGKTPDEWHQQEMQENHDMPMGENDELNNYDTGAGFFQLDENGGDVEITSMHKTGTKVHMGGGQFNVIRDPWRYHSAFAGMLHPQENIGRIGGMGGHGENGIQQFHQHFTYINNNRNENHKVQNLVHHEHEPEVDHHEHHYEEHHDDQHQHHDHRHHGEGDGHEGNHDDDHHHHHHENDEDHHHYEEHRMDDHHLKDHPDEEGEQGYQRQFKVFPGSDVKTTEEATGTPSIDNYQEDRAPKRDGDIIRDVASITPKDAPDAGKTPQSRSQGISAFLSGYTLGTRLITPKQASIPSTENAKLASTENALKRNDVSFKEKDDKTLEDQIDMNGARNAFFTGLKHEAELDRTAHSSSSDDDTSGDITTDDESGNGEDDDGVETPSKKMKTTFENHAENKQPNILDLQQFHVQGPKSFAVPQSWISREFVEPMSPMVVKRTLDYKNKNRKRKNLVLKTFFKMVGYTS